MKNLIFTFAAVAIALSSYAQAQPSQQTPITTPNDPSTPNYNGFPSNGNPVDAYQDTSLNRSIKNPKYLDSSKSNQSKNKVYTAPKKKGKTYSNKSAKTKKPSKTTDKNN